MIVDTVPLLRELRNDNIGMLSLGELRRRGYGELIEAAKEAQQIIILSESRYTDLASVLLLDAGFEALKKVDNS